VRTSFDLARGVEGITRLLERWRDALEKTVTPWERRASIPDAAVASADIRPGVLALATADDHPSSPAIATGDEEPWRRREDALPKEESPLVPTGTVTSMSRVGAVAADALTMPPLPAAAITSPPVPVYGPPSLSAPQKVFSGRLAAATIALVMVALAVATVFLFRWLSGPT
jgi:hypothetical protein